MDEINYNELFEVSEQAEPDENTGTEENAAEAPAEESAAEARAVEENAETPEEQTDADKPSPRNARYAAARRAAEAERDDAVARIREESRAEIQRTREEAARQMDELFKDSGILNPYTKTPINSKAEYDAYRAQLQEERKRRITQKAGMSEAELSEFVSGLPEVRQAREAQKKAELEAQRAREVAAKARMQEELAEIAKLDPSIRSMEDLAKMDNFEAFAGLVKRGNSFQDAYKLVNFDRLTQQAAEAVKKSALQAERGKEHLSATKSRGSYIANVPADIREEYRMFVPDASEEDIQKHYNRYLKGE